MTRNSQSALARDERFARRRSPSDLDTPTPLPLREAERDEALSFLAARPLQTFFLAGLIRDNGVESPLNRGTFYACRDAAGKLEGIALVGHATAFEARTDGAVCAFARLAQAFPHAHLLAGEREALARFWESYSDAGQRVRLA